MTAERLRGVLRPGDTVGRIGGDEFVLLAEQLSEPNAALLIADRVRAVVNAPIDIHGRTVTVDCSIGITLRDSHSPEELLQQADTALCRAKGRGRGRWELYDQAMQLGAQRRLDTEALLRGALANDAVVVHYQPIVSLPTGRYVGAEALVRLVDEHGDLRQPDEFIAVAEASGLVVPLGLQVLALACDEQARRLAVDEATTISVNVAAQQLRSPSLVTDVLSCGLPSSALCLELTESSLIEADRSTLRAVHELSDAGVTLALDDFGTGWSSLAYLRRFPVDVLKIDRSFISGLGRNHGDTELVKSIIGLGESLGLRTVAEGVETRQQARLLTELGCRQAQGYLFGRPAPSAMLSTTTASHLK